MHSPLSWYLYFPSFTLNRIIKIRTLTALSLRKPLLEMGKVENSKCNILDHICHPKYELINVFPFGFSFQLTAHSLLNSSFWERWIPTIELWPCGTGHTLKMCFNYLIYFSSNERVHSGTFLPFTSTTNNRERNNKKSHTSGQ